MDKALYGNQDISDDELEALESAIAAALQPVEPQATFREGLRQNLEVARLRKDRGVCIDPVCEARSGVRLGVAFGLLGLLVGTLIYLCLRSPRTKPAESSNKNSV
ncbi:MAG: hypothetical protein GXY52_02260 [Chloroflexi bacterium]|nr:hypothetical protein [Chloroflexota bacterium]